MLRNLTPWWIAGGLCAGTGIAALAAILVAYVVELVPHSQSLVTLALISTFDLAVGAFILIMAALVRRDRRRK